MGLVNFLGHMGRIIAYYQAGIADPVIYLKKIEEADWRIRLGTVWKTTSGLIITQTTISEEEWDLILHNLIYISVNIINTRKSLWTPPMTS